MNDRHDPNQTVDSSSVPPDSLDAGMAAGFGQHADGPRSGLDDSLRPHLLLREAEGESAHIVKPNSDAMPPKSTLGDRYQLSGEIARGGMGAVLRGRDVDLGRDLAIKVLLEKHANNPSGARRFLEEAQIGGQLQHPGVVPVYDIGRFGDLPFFAMKLVKGKTLATLLSERADPTTERPRFLSIALQVTLAMAYAHAKGVIHRDLKPANIMVGAFGEVQVMDWGLAKVLPEGGIADEEKANRQYNESEDITTIRTARSGSNGSQGTETEAGSLLGTPAYMPPEQANGEVALLDRRADVFGLGAILCAILTGKPPYVGRSAEEVRRKAANSDLADAYARLASCGADAELITLTRICLSPEAVDRPKDARAVADALTAYLDGVQERLRQAELAEAEARARALEEAKRRRLTLALAATVLLALTLGGGGWLWVKADRDARQAQVAREVNDAVNKATALREQAKAATVGGAALLAQAREQTQRALALAENGPADAMLKEQVRTLGAELDEEEKDRQLLASLDEARLAQAETVVGESRFAIERAVPLLREAFRAYGLPVGEGEPDAVAARIRQRPDRVREMLVAALDEWVDLATLTKIVTEPHRDWLRAVALAAEAEDGWRRQLRAARAEKDLTKRRAALEKLAEEAEVGKLPAQSLTRLASQLVFVKAEVSAVRFLRRAREQYPADFWINQTLGMLLQKVTPPEQEEAVRFLTAAVALRPESAGAYLNLGVALKNKGQVDEAITCFHKAITLDPKYAAAYSSLGNALKSKGQVNEAIVCYQKAIALDPKVAMYHSNLGVALREKGQVDEAIACFKKALALDPNDAAAHSNLGFALAAKGQVDAASACYHKAIALDPKFAAAHLNLGIALHGKGQVDEAIACYHKAIAIDPKLAEPQVNLGIALHGKGQVDEAIACYHKAIAIDPKCANAHGGLGLALLDKGHYAEARDASARALVLLPASSPVRASTSRMVQECERLLKLEARLPTILRREDQPASARENLELARICTDKKMNAAATRFFATAFATDGKLADDLQAGHRYNAACSAVLAAAGQGEDAAKLDDKERARLRKQTLDWLQADLAARRKQLQSWFPGEAAKARASLAHWQEDTDLAAIRDQAALDKLPVDEQKAFAQLWADVVSLLKKVDEKPK